MTRWILGFLVLLAALWLLTMTGLLPQPVAEFLGPILGLACSIGWPLFLITIYVAPGLFLQIATDFKQFWQRIRTRRLEVSELERKIAHLDKPHHMVQLGTVFRQQGKLAKATHWFESALAKDDTILDARYKLALCYYSQGRFSDAVNLLEQVHVVQPNYDYGVAYLRLAQSQHKVGNATRASEIYQTMLRFYPGHPEGCYHYGLLLFDQQNIEQARVQMREVMFSVRHSPSFHRRRNRHWLLKAQWWLWRH